MSARIAVLKSRGVPLGLADVGLDGGTRNLIETVRAYARSGMTVSIFTSAPDLVAPQIETVDGVCIHRLPLTFDRRLSGIALDIERAEGFGSVLAAYPPYADVRFDFLHSHHWTSVGSALLAAQPMRRRHVHTPHLLFAEKRRLLDLAFASRASAIEGHGLAAADRVIAVSRAEANAVTLHYGIETQRLAVIPNGVSQAFVDARVDDDVIAARFAARPLQLVSVGRLARQKGVDILIRAVALATRNGLDVRCTIVGGAYHSEAGEPAALLDLATELDVADRVAFVGHRPTCEVIEYLRAAAAYVQPTRYESQGLAILEAMAVGLPVITTRLPALVEQLRDGVNGRLVATERPEAVVEALGDLVERPAQAAAMGLANRQRAAAADWSTACAATLACFDAEDSVGR